MEKTSKIQEYNKLLLEGKILDSGPFRGSFILLPNGWIIWQEIQKILDKKFAKRSVKNVSFPTLIPYSLLKKEITHVNGFNPECFFIEKIGNKILEDPLIIRPTSEVLFYYHWAKKIYTHQELPILYNQWCQVFRVEKNTKPFFRNTEFLWQEGHTIHKEEKEARELVKKIISDYRKYIEKKLCISVVIGLKTEKEKFAGAQKTYTVECLLPDGQCLQLATSHYLGNNFTSSFDVRFRDKKNQLQFAFSTSWGTSTRAIGALVASHSDEKGLVFPFSVAPIQIALIIIPSLQTEILNDYRKKIYQILSKKYRCHFYSRHNQVSQNLAQSDKEGCALKIIIGNKEVEKKTITLITRINDEKITTTQEKMLKMIRKLFEEMNQKLYQKSFEFRDNHTFSITNRQDLQNHLNFGNKGMFSGTFCNNSDCEEDFKNQFPSYSVRCLSLNKKFISTKLCFFCQRKSKNIAFLARSY